SCRLLASIMARRAHRAPDRTGLESCRAGLLNPAKPAPPCLCGILLALALVRFVGGELLEVVAPAVVEGVVMLVAVARIGYRIVGDVWRRILHLAGDLLPQHRDALAMACHSRSEVRAELLMLGLQSGDLLSVAVPDRALPCLQVRV